MSKLAKRLAREIEGEVLFDAATRGRYSTDASIYQVDPVGVVVPKSERDAKIAMQIAAEEGIPILPRGAGSSQCGQAVGAALVIDSTKYLSRVVSVDRERAMAVVEPGVVLDALNAQLRKDGLWFPVDVSTSAQATIGGMAGNNSCGSRSIRYGNMVHNVLGIDALLADGSELHFGPVDSASFSGPSRYVELVRKVHAIAEREADEIEARWPKVLRHVQGYNLDLVRPASGWNFAHLLVGSEGTLAYSKRIHLKLSPLPRFRALGVCHFATFRRAMEAPQHIVRLQPTAVELVDRTMIGLARSNPAYRGVVEKFIQGDPDAILLVEFAGEDRDGPARRLDELAELMGDLRQPDTVVKINDAVLQREIWEVRKAGLNIMMSMKGDGKPVSFIEDCAVPLENLAEYTDALTRVFRKHGTEGTWYAHASVGTLHVRPVLNMKTDGAEKMRAIAEEACALVKRYKGAAYSGEHGDGLVRSEWIAPIIGERLVAALGEIKALFDPKNLMNPGKIVRPSKQDDRTLFRFKPGYAIPNIGEALDWSEWTVPGAASTGFAAAVEMCNNNGHCRKFDAGTMCPSFRATGDEKHLTRGRANTLRLALSGQLGPDAFTSDEMFETLDLCVSCKGCRRECPTGVDMAKMKIEFLHHYHARHGYSLRDRLVAWLPRYAPLASRFHGITNAYQRMARRALGFAAERSLPKWRRAFLSSLRASHSTGKAGEVVLFVDTFSNYFEPENARAALAVLDRAGYGVHIARAEDGGRPLCCGRTFLAAGMVEEARTEAKRVLAALEPYVGRGVPVVGLEPSCILGLRDEFRSMLPGGETDALAESALLFEEFLVGEHDAGRLNLKLNPLPGKALLHGHCHQKAFGAMPAVQRALALVPGLRVETIESSCCGMAGAFGYEASHYGVSMKMAEASLLPRVRAAGEDTILVADGTSCRHQIADGAARQAVHVAQVLARSLA
ncbi:MAG TPA: FAD-linked oxidase C-terminal domain-containing protein [Burkholderiales bacterium]|nr:FAD-linked oxidase C-terminal domain-containing protein [Burkholderiales bacterium]HUK05511.1 FAD-linked oxidase C-terminal domain-containing protein [Burkholderiales bacterium]